MKNESYQKLEELKARHAKEIARLEKEIDCAERLPIAPDRIIHQRDEVWASYEGPDKDKDGRTIYGDRPVSLKDALAIVRTYRMWEHADGIEECEHWKSGCVSTQPPELTEKHYKERGELVGSHDIELRLERANYGNKDELTFHVKDKRDGQWYRVCIRVMSPVHPRIEDRYDRFNFCVFRKYSAPDLTELPECHATRKWSFGDGIGRQVEEGCHISLYFHADEFEAWAERVA